ncbi:hypothetical protein LOK49_LG03G01967 [Camellia lanceoleosa]|uniref:Uncharacterized protein n=1 Tax=Camellia lanceoleosa TaxID=1840588 RepID=A0ACC0IGB5_9ERIC|nr:hypothetical protein LOK49_LG03G01967 [Camellia lanceoleosa]
MEHENIVRLLDVQHRKNKILLVLEYLEFNLWEFIHFGMSRTVDVPLKIYTKKVASLCYMAPEILFGVGQYSAPVDMWAVGCIFGEMVRHPYMFSGCGETDLLLNIFRTWQKKSQALNLQELIFFLKCSVWTPGGMLASMLTLEMYRSHPDFLMAIPFFHSAVA